MYKVDLHTHSTASPDGGLSLKQYTAALQEGTLDYAAITDHNTTNLAFKLQRLHADKIIVGEEIMTTDGEVVGLFLKKEVKPGLSALETMKIIKAQDGIVYIPHPLETVRHGLTMGQLDELAEYIDIIEVCNGRALLQNRGPAATTWAHLNRKAGAASSDAHGAKGLGRTYSMVSEVPTAANIVSLLATARLITERPPLISLLYPKLNRLKKGFRS